MSRLISIDKVPARCAVSLVYSGPILRASAMNIDTGVTGPLVVVDESHLRWDDLDPDGVVGISDAELRADGTPKSRHELVNRLHEAAKLVDWEDRHER